MVNMPLDNPDTERGIRDRVMLTKIYTGFFLKSGKMHKE